MYSFRQPLRNARNALEAARADLELYKDLYIGRSTPIIVYQMGKVGSSSVVESVARYRAGAVYHVHRLNPENIAGVRSEYSARGLKPPRERIGQFLYRTVVAKRRRAKFITLVREPIGRNVSAFFQNYQRFTGSQYQNASHPLQALVDLFLSEYPHSVPLTWFDMELKKMLGIDIYESPFPKEKGYLSLENGAFQLLILKSEIDDTVKESAIAAFLDLEDFRLGRYNVGEGKEYADTYRVFLRTVQLPALYVDMMCDSEYTKHFYSKNEIEAIRSSWQVNHHRQLSPSVLEELSLAASRKVR